MRHMTPDERRAFLTRGTRTAKLATVRADGRPHVTPIWFVLDGDTFVFTISHGTVKAANLRHDPRACLCVDEETPPFAFVQAEGTATLHDADPELLRWATRIAARYMGADQADAYGQRNGMPGELLVRFTPSRFIAQQAIAD